MTTSMHERLAQVLTLLDKEDRLLSGVRNRLFQGPTLDAARLAALLETPEGIDRLESFTSKFCRMQDTFVDKLLPIYLRSLGELAGSAIDNLRRAEQLGLIDNAESWVEMRLLRNRLVHEYVDNVVVLAEQLQLAKQQAESLHQSYLKLRGA
ncbi:MAG: hypothetical protein IPJ52_15670 [Rhodocyclaceae bacterium]|nr:hypothetical protein [Rhodocyclaceae bacterium]